VQEVRTDGSEQSYYLLCSLPHLKRTATVHVLYTETELRRLLTAIGLSRTFTKLQHLARLLQQCCTMPVCFSKSFSQSLCDLTESQYSISTIF